MLSQEEQKQWWESMFQLDDELSSFGSRFHKIFDEQLPRLGPSLLLFAKEMISLHL